MQHAGRGGGEHRLVVFGFEIILKKDHLRVITQDSGTERIREVLSSLSGLSSLILTEAIRSSLSL
jgi:hypothetical protein